MCCHLPGYINTECAAICRIIVKQVLPVCLGVEYRRVVVDVDHADCDRGGGHVGSVRRRHDENVDSGRLAVQFSGQQHVAAGRAEGQQWRGPGGNRVNYLSVWRVG